MAQYDSIGAQYQQVKTAVTLPLAERHTFAQLVGDVRGKRVCDLACGTGFYTRMLKSLGAEKVVGVDISAEMVKSARAQEEADRLGVDYHVADAAEMPDLGRFDLVTAVYLLNYAETPDHMRRMFERIFASLADGGRLVAFTFNPRFDKSRSNSTPYGFTVGEEVPEEERHVVEVTAHLETPIVIRNYRWHAPVYERSAAAAGLTGFRWHPIAVPPEAVEKYGAEYWRGVEDNPLITALTCER